MSVGHLVSHLDHSSTYPIDMMIMMMMIVDGMSRLLVWSLASVWISCFCDCVAYRSYIVSSTICHCAECNKYHDSTHIPCLTSYRGVTPKSRALSELREVHTIALTNLEETSSLMSNTDRSGLAADLLVEIGSLMVTHMVLSPSLSVTFLAPLQLAQFASDLAIAKGCADRWERNFHRDFIGISVRFLTYHSIIEQHRYHNIRCRVNAELLMAQVRKWRENPTRLQRCRWQSYKKNWIITTLYRWHNNYNPR